MIQTGANQMTPEEIIATKLLGWERGAEDDGQVVYLHKESGSVHYFGGELDGCGMGQLNGADFPDLSNWSDIRRMEDALETDEHYLEYRKALLAETESAIAMNDYMDWYRILRATPEQRVQAALKVIEEAGL